MYRATYRGFKSLILRQNVGNPPEVTSDENSYAEIDDSRTIPDVPINKGYLTKITAERARRERPDFIAPGTTNEVQKALVGKPLEKVVRSAPVIQGEIQAPQSTKVIKLDGGRISLITVQINFKKARVSSLLILNYPYLYLPPTTRYYPHHY